VLQRQVELGWRRADLVAAFRDLVQQGMPAGPIVEAAPTL
jgi:hypothetical protein